MISIVWPVVAMLCTIASLFMLTSKRSVRLWELLLIIVLSAVPGINLLMVVVILLAEYEIEVNEFFSMEIIKRRTKK